MGLREANQHFSKAIRAVRAGKEVVLTERGRPIAVILPIAAEAAEDAGLRAMAGEGLVMPAARKGRMPAARWRPARVKGGTVAQTIIDEREDRA